VRRWDETTHQPGTDRRSHSFLSDIRERWGAQSQTIECPMPYDPCKKTRQAIRTIIGQELVARYDAAQSLPERLSVLLMQLDEPQNPECRCPQAENQADFSGSNSPGIGVAFSQGPFPFAVTAMSVAFEAPNCCSMGSDLHPRAATPRAD
jgi:hypothetical protein